MAATAAIVGRFAARTRKTWDSFTDGKTGEIIDSGRSLVLWVVSDGDDEINKINVPRDLLEAAEEATKGLKFGDPVQLRVSVTQYGNKFVAAQLPAKTS